MNKKERILKNLANYSPEEIADAVKKGIVSMYELGKYTEGAFTPLLKRRVKELLEYGAGPTAEQPIEDTPATGRSPIVSNEQTAEENPIFDKPDRLDASEAVYTPSPESPGVHTEKVRKQCMFRRPFSFRGRIRRTEYGISFIVYCFIFTMLQNAVLYDAIPVGLYFPVLIVLCWFIWAQGAKRCHDIGNSGWYQIIPFYVLWMLFAPGDIWENEYGDTPK